VQNFKTETLIIAGAQKPCSSYFIFYYYWLFIDRYSLNTNL